MARAGNDDPCQRGQECSKSTRPRWREARWPGSDVSPGARSGDRLRRGELRELRELRGHETRRRSVARARPSRFFVPSSGPWPTTSRCCARPASSPTTSWPPSAAPPRPPRRRREPLARIVGQSRMAPPRPVSTPSAQVGVQAPSKQNPNEQFVKSALGLHVPRLHRFLPFFVFRRLPGSHNSHSPHGFVHVRTWPQRPPTRRARGGSGPPPPGRLPRFGRCRGAMWPGAGGERWRRALGYSRETPSSSAAPARRSRHGPAPVMAARHRSR